MINYCWRVGIAGMEGHKVVVHDRCSESTDYALEVGSRGKFVKESLNSTVTR